MIQHTAMKNIIKSLALLLTLSTFAANATDLEKNPGTENEAKTFQTNVFKGKKATQFYCFVDKQVGQRLTITIRDQKNNVLNEQYIPKNTTHVAQVMDLSQLADGDYTLTISDANRMVVHPVRIKTAAAVRYVYVSEDDATTVE
ncbi:hypothetical protein BWI93_21805 [Siphonobacter sp. BAB-5385]|nr:hypothetical protein BWI93_21805 [Siphonobacter sp. BAB-5385]PMD94378.1 hypothetical protein BWI97_16880 [Siphonobacter sp. BAB-5405]